MPPNKDYVKSVDEGHFVTCEGDADDNLKWLKPDGMEVDGQIKSRVHQVKVNGKLQLVFVYVSKEDQGEWSCVSNFEDGGDGKSFTMNVYGKDSRLSCRHNWKHDTFFQCQFPSRLLNRQLKQRRARMLWFPVRSMAFLSQL